MMGHHLISVPALFPIKILVNLLRISVIHGTYISTKDISEDVSTYKISVHFFNKSEPIIMVKLPPATALSQLR